MSNDYRLGDSVLNLERLVKHHKKSFNAQAGHALLIRSKLTSEAFGAAPVCAVIRYERSALGHRCEWMRNARKLSRAMVLSLAQIKAQERRQPQLRFA